MSLIPSESYSFPEHFRKTVAASRKQKNIEPKPEPEMIEPVRKRPALVALPNPKPRVVAKPQPVAKPEPVLEPESLVMPETGIGSEPMAESEPLTRPELFAEPEIMAEPEPVIAKEILKPVPKIAPRVPNPALRRASAPPPRIPEAPVRKTVLPTLKPKVRWNNRAPAMDPAAAANNGSGNGTNHLAPEPEPLLPPAQNVIQMKPAPPASRSPRAMPRPERIPPPPITKSIPVAPPSRRPSSPPPAMPKPATFTPPQKPVQRITPAPAPPPIPKRENARPAAPAQPKTPMRAAPRPIIIAPDPQTDFFQDFADSGETAVLKRRRKAKIRRFLICESIAVGVLLSLVILGLAHRPESGALVWIMNIMTIASAVAAALIPILFFALNPTLPEIER